GEGMADVIAEHDASVIIMHMQGTPRTMQKSPKYGDVVADISTFLEDRIAVAEKAGISADKIMIDPGIGFGKNLDHNIEILTRLRELRSLGKAIAIGVSRKSFIGKITGSPIDDRRGGSLAAAVLAVANGANVIRAHDVAETAQALKVAWPIIQNG
ncbi:MAG: dihydropteroate synthase, partial [Thermoplasmata archaeon]